MLRKIASFLNQSLRISIRVVTLAVLLYGFAFVASVNSVLLEQDQKTDVICEAIKNARLLAISRQTPNFENLLKTNVVIYNLTKECAGSGVVLDVYGKTYILSAAHLDDPTDLFYMDEDNTPIKLKIVKTDKVKDLLLFEAEALPATLHTSSLASTEPNIGERVWAVGNPAMLEDAITSGEIMQKERDSYYSNCLIYMGNSGGGMFNKNGQLVGINVGLKFRPPHYGVSVSVRLKAILAFLEEFKNEVK